MHRGANDAVDWYFKAYMLPRPLFKGGASVFWEFRGFFTRLYAANSDMGTWIHQRRPAWDRLWEADGIMRCDLRPTQSQAHKDHLSADDKALVLKTCAKEAVMGTDNLLAVLCDFATTGRGHVRGAAKEGLASLAGSSVVDVASVKCGPDLFGRCTVGRDARGRCCHLQGPAGRLDALHGAGSNLGAAVAEAVTTAYKHRDRCMDAAVVRKHLLATVARAMDVLAPSLSMTPEDIPLLAGAKRARRIDNHWTDRVAVGLVHEGRVKTATMAGRYKDGRGKRTNTYANTTVKVMSKYAWNIPKTFAGVYQICTASDGSGKAGAERLSTAVCSFRVKRAAWLPPQANYPFWTPHRIDRSSSANHFCF